jgi:hypothetical protein
LIDARAPGDTVPLVFRQRGLEVWTVLRLRADRRLEVRPAELAGRTTTAAQRGFRSAWLKVAPAGEARRRTRLSFS